MTDTTADKLVSIKFLVDTLGPVGSLDLAMKTLAHISNRDDGKIHDNELLFLLRVVLETQDALNHKADETPWNEEPRPPANGWKPEPKSPIFDTNKTLHPEELMREIRQQTANEHQNQSNG